VQVLFPHEFMIAFERLPEVLAVSTLSQSFAACIKLSLIYIDNYLDL